MPLEFTEAQRRALSTRLMVQARSAQELTPKQIAAVRRDMDSRVRGLPGDVFMCLDALRLLADQGNIVAAAIFDKECEKLGLTRPAFFHG